MMNNYNSLGYRAGSSVLNSQEPEVVGNAPNSSGGSRTSWLLSLFMMVLLLSGLNSFAQVNAYGFAQSSGTYTAVASPTVVAASGWDDTAVTAVTIGFTYVFNGVSYTTCNVNPNGHITFGTGTGSYTPISGTTTYAGAVSAFGRDLISNASTIVRGVEGVSPNRVFVVQWNNAGRYNSGLVAGDVLNFQIRLYETSNNAEVRFGTCTATNTTALTGQTGLRGATNAAFVNRTSATSWATSTAGTLNTDTMNSLNTIMPASGLTFTWNPPPPCSGTPTGGTAAPLVSNVCPTSTAALSVTGDSSGVSSLTYQWETSADGLTGWANATGTSTAATYTTAAYVSGTQYYRRKTTCTPSTLFGYSSVVSVTGPAAPSTQVTNIIATTATNTSVTLAWTIGNGNNRSVFVSDTNSFVDPVNGVIPGTASTVYSGTGQKLVYDGTAATVTVTGLAVGTTYYVRAYESRKCTSPAYFYNTSTATGNGATVKTLDKLKYTITRSAGVAYTPVSASAVRLNAANTTADDTNYGPITFFPFTYAGATFSSFRACTNGFMTLNATNTNTSFNNGITSTAGNNLVLAPFWEDLYFNNSASSDTQFLKYEITGTTGSRVLTVQWENVEVFNYAGPSINFQAKLYEVDSHIEYVYGVMQGFDGTNPLNATVTNGFAFSYTTGMSSASWGTLAGAGEVIALQQANKLSFTSLGGVTTNEGVNKLSIMPDCNSMFTFTPAATVRPNDAPLGVPSPPDNDEPANATPLTTLASVPANFCGSFYSSAFATPSAGVAAAIASTNADDDVWFKFTAISSNTTITLRGSGGYDAAMQLFAVGDLSTVLASRNANNMAGTSLTEIINQTNFVTTIGTEYYVRVYHAGGGTSATATATVAAGVITGFTVTAPGSGYVTCNGGAGLTATPFVYITDATGAGAVAKVTVSGTGTITAIALQGSQGGSGYSASPTVTVASPSYGVTGDFSIIVNATPDAPSNDDPCGAVALIPGTSCVPYSDAGNKTNVVGATTTTSNGVLAPACASSGVNVNDVWFKFTATSTTTAIKVLPVAGFNVAVQGYTVASGTCGTTNLLLTSAGCVNGVGAGLEEVIDFNGTVIGNDYYLRVYAFPSGTGGGASTIGSQFSICVYNILPACTTNTAPVTAATNTSLTPTLSWTAATYATAYDVYLGTTSGPTTLIGSSTTTSYTVTAPLAGTTQYFWYVVPKNVAGAATCGAANETTFTTMPACTGTPTAGSATSSAASVCVTGSVVLSVNGQSTTGGVQLQWYNSAGLISGATSATYTTPVLTASETYYCEVKCFFSGLSANTNSVVIGVDNPLVSTTAPGTRCGVGTVVLGATGSTGTTLNWYGAASGGASIGTGASFTTPSISATTQYWVSAVAAGASAFSIGQATDLAANLSSLGGYGMYFATVPAATINTVDIYPSTAGTLNVTLENAVGTVIDTKTFTIVAGDVSTTVKKTLALNFSVPAGSTGWSINYDLSINRGGVGTYTYPVSNSGFSITGNTIDGDNLTTGTRYYFYNWNVSTPCASPRVQVQAEVTTPPTLTLSSTSASICAGDATATPVSVSVGAGDFDTFVWSPSTGVSGTTAAYTFNPTATTTYTLTATSASGCVATATFNVTVNPLPVVTVNATNTTICAGEAFATLEVAAPSNVTIGVGTVVNTTSTPYKGFWGGSKSQMLYTAAELTAQGLVSGSQINAISFNIAAFTSPYTFNGFNISMKNTATTTLLTTLETGLTTVLNPSNYTLTGTAPFTATHTLSTPFTWDGTSNLLVETCFNNNNSGGVSANSADVKSSTVTGRNVYYTSDNNATVCSAPGTATSSTSRPNITFGIAQNAITWTPITGLFTDAGLTTAYTTGADVSKVYAQPSMTTNYVARATNGATCFKDSTPAVVTVNVSVGGTAVGGATVCINASTPSLSLTGSTGAVIRWEKSVAPFTTWTAIASSATATYVGTFMTVNTQFRAVVKNGTCLESTSTPTTVTVNPGCSATITTIRPIYWNATVAPNAYLTYQAVALPSGSSITRYGVEVKNLTSNVVGTFESTAASFRLIDASPTVASYGNSFAVRVKLQVNGVWEPYGIVKNVSTAALPPTTTLSTLCGQTMTTIEQIAYCAVVPLATLYTFEITQGANTATITNTFNNFKLTNLDFTTFPITYNTVYSVRIKVKTMVDGNEVESAWSTPCTITTPATAPSIAITSGCGVLTSNYSLIKCTLVRYATEYTFDLVSSVNTLTISRPYNSFSASLVSGIVPGTAYTVTPTYKLYGQLYSGTSCSITTPGVSPFKTEVNVSTDFTVKAYPNPFAENFKLNVSSSFEGALQVKVYDMLGKLVENKELNISDIETFEVGNKYPSGVYNVVVSQGDKFQSIRVIKR